MARALTTRAVEAAKPGDNRREISDGLVTGLYLVVQPSGTRSWALRYRHNGKPRKLTLGTVIDLAEAEAPEPVLGGPLTLAGARKLARDALGEVALHRDPADDKKRDRESRRAGDDLFPIVAEKFIDKRKAKKSWRETAMYLGLKEDGDGKLVPTGRGPAAKWKAKRIQDITDFDVLDLIDHIDGPVAANRMLAWLHVLFEWAKPRFVKVNPCAGIKRPNEEKPRDRVLTDSEIGYLWRATDAIGDLFGHMVKVLLFTGCRLREVAHMEWGELDLDNAVWHLPAERAKNGEAHDIALAPVALNIIKAMPRIGRKSRYVFTTNGTSPVSGFSRMKARLDARMLEAMQADDPEAELKHFTLHDLRRVVASGMARLGVNLPVIEKCLAHKSGSFAGIVSVYQRHSFAEEQAKAWQVWADLVLTLVEDRDDNVVQLVAR